MPKSSWNISPSPRKCVGLADVAGERGLMFSSAGQVTVGYGPPPSTYPTYPSIPLRERIRPHEYPPEWDIPWDKIESRYEVTKQAIGPYGAEYYLYTELRYRIIQLFTNADDAAKANMDVMLAAYSSLDMDAMQEPEFIPPSPKVLELDTLLAKYSPLFADAQDAPTTTLDVSLEWCTPQVRTLAEILLEHYTPSFQGIVFVEQRHVAFALARLLPRLTTLKGKIKSAELVGHGASAAAKAKVRGMALQNQQDVVKQFRNGELNLRMSVPDFCLFIRRTHPVSSHRYFRR
jgi:endoribonuclease Dicer